MGRTILLAILSTFVFSCERQKVDQQAESRMIMELSREWAKSAATENIEQTLSYWSDDAVCLFPGQPKITGKEEIRQMLKATSSIPGFEVSWEPKEAFVSMSGDFAYVLAQNYFRNLDSLGNTNTTFNKGIEIWKKQPNGEWKCVVDIYNSDPSIKTIK